MPKNRGSVHQRSFTYYVALVLTSALLFSSMTLSTQAQKHLDAKSLDALLSLLKEADALAKDASVRSALKQASEAVLHARKGAVGSKAVAREMQTVRDLLRRIAGDSRGESSKFQDRIAGAQKIFGPDVPPNPNALPDIDSDGNPRRNNGLSYPVTPFRGRFRVTLNGFRVNHQTNQGLWASWDAVTFYPNVTMVDASGQWHHYLWGGSTTTIGARPEYLQGGSASSMGGLKTDDGFPNQTTPWRRTGSDDMRPPGTIPPTVYFDQELVQNTNAGVIIPTIWAVDGRSDMNLPSIYQWQINHDVRRLGLAVARIIRGPQPLTLDSYLRAGHSMGLNIGLRLPIGVPQDRPIGMQPEQDQFGFIPQVLVLTYDSAEYLSRTDFGVGIGVVPVRYVDPQSFAGDYTLYLQVERVNN